MIALPAPYASFVTRNGSFQADGNGLISNVQMGLQALDLIEFGCVPLAFNPFANFRNLIDGGDFSINPFQRNIPGLASGGVIATPVAATPTYFADRFFASGEASSAIRMAAVADTSVPGFNQNLKISRQAGNSNVAAINVGQVVETFDALRCQGQTVTLSFWAKAGANYSGGALAVQAMAGAGVNQSAASLVAGTWTGQSAVISAAGATSAMIYRFKLLREIRNYSDFNSVWGAIVGRNLREVVVVDRLEHRSIAMAAHFRREGAGADKVELLLQIALTPSPPRGCHGRGQRR